MAYTIISQNNTTTTLSDENGNVITVPARVTLATSTDYTIIKVNNNSVDLESGDGKIIRGVPACVVLAGGGGGGSVDTSKVVNADVLPTADASSAGKYYLYTGATTAEYTQNYIYKNVKTATYTGTVSFAFGAESSVNCSASDFANFIASEGGVDPTLVVRGGMTYKGDNLWELVGYNSGVDELFTIREYTEDFEDAGFTFSGTPTIDDAMTYDCTITEASATYAWTRVDVQPAPEALPDQTGQSGKFLTTDGTDASWSDKPLVNTETGTNSLAILGTPRAKANVVVVGKSSRSDANYGICLGVNARVGSGATNAIQLGSTGSATTNSDANTFKVANANGNFEIMSADGTVPHGRLTNAVVSNAVTIAVADWNGGTTCTKTISGLTATSVVWVAPDNASQSDYLTAGVYASNQTTDTITFTCTTTPTSALTVNVIYC